MSNLLDSVKSHITPDLIRQAAAQLGESEGGIAKAIGGIAPTLLAGLLNKTGEAVTMDSVFNALSKFDPAVLDHPGSLIGGGNLAHNDPKDASGHVLGSIFGAKVPAITNALAAFSGTRASSVSTLLGVVGPLVMGVLHQKISADDLNVSGFAHLLQNQQNSILGALPTGLGSIIGLAQPGSSTPDNLPVAEGNQWLWPLLLLFALGLGITWYIKYGSIPEEATRSETPPPPAAEAPVTVAPPAVATLNFPAGTREADMLAFVRDEKAVPDKKTWFDFPEIMFDVNKATLRPESETKLNAVLAILKEYPAVKLRIGGYTDSDGHDAVNLKLSGERANACKLWFIGKGIRPERLEAEGYGEQHPVAPNDSPENKAKNRRISFSVREK